VVVEVEGVGVKDRVPPQAERLMHLKVEDDGGHAGSYRGARRLCLPVAPALACPVETPAPTSSRRRLTAPTLNRANDPPCPSRIQQSAPPSAATCVPCSPKSTPPTLSGAPAAPPRRSLAPVISTASEP